MRRTGKPDSPATSLATSPEVEQARALLETPRTGLLWHYDLGALLRRILKEERRSGLVLELASALGISTAKVYQHTWFAGEYDRAGVDALEKRSVSWSFVIALMGTDDVLRSYLLSQAVEEKWTLARLRLELRSLQGSRREGAGRKRQPRKAQGGMVDLARLELATRDWLELFEVSWEERRGRDGTALAELSRLRATPDNLPHRLNELSTSLIALSQEAKTLADRLRRLADEVRQEPEETEE